MSYSYSEEIQTSFGNLAGVTYCLQTSWDYYSDELLHISFVAYKTLAEEIVRNLKSNDLMAIRSGGYGLKKQRGAKYHIEMNKNSNSDLYHVTVFAKDSCKTNSSGEDWVFYFFVDKDDPNKVDRLKELLLDKLLKFSSIPVLPEWIDHIYDSFSDNFRQSRTCILNDVREIECYRLAGNQNVVRDIIQTGLKTKVININGTNEPSMLLDSSSGLNEYLSLFGSILADKIQSKFRPKFIPGTDKYSNHLLTLDDYIHHKGIELYAAQMAVIQASANNFNINKHGFIVGEMGSGIIIGFQLK